MRQPAMPPKKLCVSTIGMRKISSTLGARRRVSSCSCAVRYSTRVPRRPGPTTWPCLLPQHTSVHSSVMGHISTRRIGNRTVEES